MSKKDIRNDLSEKLNNLKATCNEVGIRLVKANITGLLNTHHLNLEEADFVSLLPHEKPLTVFYETVSYEPEHFIRGTMMAHGWQESWENDPESIWPKPDEIKTELCKEIEQAASQVGHPRSLMATYTIQGQHRVCWLTSEWSEDLAEKIGQIVDLRYVRAEDAKDRAAKELISVINEVANDPEFKAIRGRPKKLLFLQKKYGNKIPLHPNGLLSRPAQNCDLVDSNLATVLVKADEIAWSDENLN